MTSVVLKVLPVAKLQTVDGNGEKFTSSLLTETGHVIFIEPCRLQVGICK